MQVLVLKNHLVREHLQIFLYGDMLCIRRALKWIVPIILQKEFFNMKANLWLQTPPPNEPRINPECGLKCQNALRVYLQLRRLSWFHAMLPQSNHVLARSQFRHLWLWNSLPWESPLCLHIVLWLVGKLFDLRHAVENSQPHLHVRVQPSASCPWAKIWIRVYYLLSPVEYNLWFPIL